MNLFDAMFIEPFLTGLCFAVLLPLFGVYLRLRDEWLAALAFAQTAAAGSLIALAFGWPLMLGGMLAAASAAVLKSLFENALRGVQGAAYAILLVAAWAISVLLVANLPLAERLGHALFDGQLYLTDRDHFLAAGACLVLSLVGLSRLSHALLLSHFFPDLFRARGRSARQAHLAFDLMAALGLALATMSIGVMAAFALIFIPPLIACRRAKSWRRALLLAATIGVLAHALAFVAALWLDQPFGPLLALLLVLAGALGSLDFRHNRR